MSIDLQSIVDKLEADSLDAICEVIGAPKAYNDGKAAMRTWFLGLLRRAAAEVEEEPVRVYIERAKSALNVTTDEQLAEKLGYSKQTIASWRRRGFVPHKAKLRITGILGGAA